MKEVVLLGVFVLMLITASSIRVMAHDDEHQSEAQTEQVENTGPDKKTEAVEVGNKVCPVTGDKIDEKDKFTYEYKGKVYNLCCQECLDEFKKDPEKYIQKLEKENGDK